MSVQYQWLATPLSQLVNSIVSPVALFKADIQEDGSILIKIMEKNILDVERETGEVKYNPVCEVGGIEGGSGWVEKVEKFVNTYLSDKLPGFNKEWWVCLRLRKLSGEDGFICVGIF